MACELSVIIPVLNEALQVPRLLTTLAAQRDCRFEAIFCDGGSVDDTLAQLEKAAPKQPFYLCILRGPAGRGRQMNSGAAQARGEFLLFLHADSFFPDPYSFARALAYLRSAQRRCDARLFAARFALRFVREQGVGGWGYYFFEEKARLNLPGCIHGDQGMLLPRLLFDRVGPFDETQPLFEDEKLAARVAERGAWLLLPLEIHTSARRFEREGLRERQILNALLMNFHHIGWDAFAQRAPGIYRNQAATRRLDLLPFFSCIAELLGELDIEEQNRLWLATGRYVRSQFWQFPFALLSLLRYGLRRPPRRKGWGVDFYGLWESFTDRRWANRLSASLVRCWFWATLTVLRRRGRPRWTHSGGDDRMTPNNFLD